MSNIIKPDKNDEEWDMVLVAGKLGERYWHDLWNFRELFTFLAWRDILVRYKQTVFGVSWSIIRPVLTMIVFSLIFGKVAKLPAGGLPYPVLVFAAMMPWQFFSSSLSISSMSMIANTNLVSKIYFPRLIIPASTIVVSLIDFIISFVIYLIMMIYYAVPFTSRIIGLPLFMIMAFIAALGPGLFISAVNVKFRDFKYVVPFITQTGLYISPVGFSSNVIPEKWRLLYSLNPMVGIIDGFRWALLGGQNELYLPGIIISIVVTGMLLVWGIVYFRRTERYFADVI